MKKTTSAALATMLLWAGCADAGEQAKLDKLGQLSLCNDPDVIYIYRKNDATKAENKPEQLATSPCSAADEKGQAALSELRTNASRLSRKDS